MGQVLHGCATTTKAIRRAIQHSQASSRQLARRYGINPKTAGKWRARRSVVDLRTGPKEPRSTILSVDEEPSWSPSVGTRCCRWMTVCTRCSRPSRT
jgi:hypothetical protein